MTCSIDSLAKQAWLSESTLNFTTSPEYIKRDFGPLRASRHEPLKPRFAG